MKSIYLTVAIAFSILKTRTFVLHFCRDKYYFSFSATAEKLGGERLLVLIQTENQIKALQVKYVWQKASSATFIFYSTPKKIPKCKCEMECADIES